MQINITENEVINMINKYSVAISLSDKTIDDIENNETILGIFEKKTEDSSNEEILRSLKEKKDGIQELKTQISLLGSRWQEKDISKNEYLKKRTEIKEIMKLTANEI